MMWSFALKGLAVLVLRYKQPGEREFRVPFNLKIGTSGNSAWAGPDHRSSLVRVVRHQSVHEAGRDHFRRRVHARLLCHFHHLRKNDQEARDSAHAELDQFNLEAERRSHAGSAWRSAWLRAGDGSQLQHAVQPQRRSRPRGSRTSRMSSSCIFDFCSAAGGGEYELAPEQLFSLEEQKLFTRALEVSEKKGKTIHLAVAAATEQWEAILRAAQSLQSSAVVLGASPNYTCRGRSAPRWFGVGTFARSQTAIDAQYLLSRPARRHVFYLGPHAPHLTPKEIDLLHSIWLELSNELAPDEIHHHDVVHFALEELRDDIRNSQRHDVMDRLRRHLDRGPRMTRIPQMNP